MKNNSVFKIIKKLSIVNLIFSILSLALFLIFIFLFATNLNNFFNSKSLFSKFFVFDFSRNDMLVLSLLSVLSVVLFVVIGSLNISIIAFSVQLKETIYKTKIITYVIISIASFIFLFIGFLIFFTSILNFASSFSTLRYISMAIKNDSLNDENKESDGPSVY